LVEDGESADRDAYLVEVAGVLTADPRRATSGRIGALP